MIIPPSCEEAERGGIGEQVRCNSPAVTPCWLCDSRFAWPLLAHRCSTVKPSSRACASMYGYQYPRFAWPLLAHRCSTVKPSSRACASMYGYQYPSWVQFPSCINVHLCCLACFTNVTCCLCCLTCFTNVDVQLSVPFLGPFPICFPNVTCSSCCLTCFTMFLVVVSCFTMLLVVVSAFGCIQTAGSTVVPNSKKMLPKGQLSPSPGRGPYAPDGVIGLTTEAYRIAFGR